jgi:hypothetical protein
MFSTMPQPVYHGDKELPALFDKKILVLPEIKPDYTIHNLLTTAHTMDWKSAKQAW